MRIVQVIDSLETGGAERMAVNYANALASRIEFSGLITTRAEGKLKNEVNQQVNYLFLKKKFMLDPRAIMRLWQYCRQHNITYIHAHSTSYFLALMVKILLPRIRIIWHDHNGNSEFLEVREAIPLNICSFFFRGIIVVNYQLKLWAEKELHSPSVHYIPNFSALAMAAQGSTVLSGLPGKRILHLANLREQKNHFFLLEVAKLVRDKFPDWTFHLVGKDFGDDYAARVKRVIAAEQLEHVVFLYGACSDTSNVIAQADIAVLTSLSEGLPVALLEYALHEKPVVTTSVGEISAMVVDGVNGFSVANTDILGFTQKLTLLIQDEPLRATMGAQLHQLIMDQYSEKAAMESYLKWIQKIGRHG